MVSSLADTQGVFFTGPFHCKSKLLIKEKNDRTTAATRCYHVLAAIRTSALPQIALTKCNIILEVPLIMDASGTAMHTTVNTWMP